MISTSGLEVGQSTRKVAVRVSVFFFCSGRTYRGPPVILLPGGCQLTCRHWQVQTSSDILVADRPVISESATQWAESQ